MNTRVLFGVLLVFVGVQSAWSDPCGMVPPIYPGQEVPLARVGLQQTYVFYKDGVETFVIRPGFTGKVDEFGMLIPFPTPPAIRKVPDHIFSHIEAAVDPPEVVVDLTPRPQLLALSGGIAKSDAKSGQKRLEFSNRVRVLRQEAVGMYEVAVLEAGSSAALKRWMDNHGYKYPKGMDKPVNDYVDDGWCFVAIKTKVGQKKGVDPKPGQRAVNSKLPKGSTFDGHVQGMGFRFKVDELVVPMRLSAFNDGELRNIVYLVTDGPRKIRSIPEEYVVRQIPGKQLIKNLTELLPLRIIGGTEADIPEYRRKQLKAQRNPVPKNGAAGELFASDLLAVDSNGLSLPHEEREKELLRIGERLGLRGGEIDKLNNESLSDQRRKTVQQSLERLKGMTLTVVDGDFPRELLGRENLTFAEYRMPGKRNRPAIYDAKLHAPSPKKQGILKVGALSPVRQDKSLAQLMQASLTAILALSLGLIGWIVIRRQARGRATQVSRLLILAMGLSPALLLAQDKSDDEKKPTIRQLVNQLSHADKAEDAIKALVKRADEAKPQLMGEAIEGNDMARRGWAIAALAEIGGKDVDTLLEKVHSDNKQPMLVRTWAAAARVYMTESTDDLIKKASLAQTFPAVGRPLGMRIVEGLSKDKEVSPEGILSVSLKVPQLQQALVPTILALGPEKLIKVMTTAKEQKVRRQATAYIGTLAQQGDKTVGKAVAKAYKFDPMAKQAPWNGGPLYVPGIRWEKEDAQQLVGNLVAWHLWCDRNGKSGEQKQIYNNLRSVGLSRVVGYQTPNNTTIDWLRSWGKVVGREGIQKILKDQGEEKNDKYSRVLKDL